MGRQTEDGRTDRQMGRQLVDGQAGGQSLIDSRHTDIQTNLQSLLIYLFNLKKNTLILFLVLNIAKVQIVAPSFPVCIMKSS